MKLQKIKKIKKNLTGFTLIELLVVISIIGILSSFAIVSLNSARQKARDALRKGDMAQLRTALEMYYDDYLSYPICGNWDDSDSDFGAIVGDDEDEGCWCYKEKLEAELTAGSRPIMPKPPRDPKNTTNSCSLDSVFNYRYVSDGNQYAIIYTLEDENEGEQILRGW